ncbi:hypothetical protein Purlil1_11487 [Purpureocillium lilacinum]|uniref:RNase H type-1 domain-containing protein n=1 Tax=Purpureocillium lilacinum TaxID=33203 RepID=A0ABR0BJP5_PURLI|nr:hypothetical protein Purlil1_11487 [Purpureocillium lilacinum]
MQLRSVPCSTASPSQTTALQEHNLPIEIRWVPAHTGVQGNEDADRAAKEATGWRERGAPGSRAEMPAELYSLRSTQKTWTHKEAQKAWAARWAAEKRGRTSYRCTPKPTKKVLRLNDGLSKRQSALFVQLVPDAADANCPCQEGRQTVSHILLRCRMYRQLRRQELGPLPGRHDLRDILSERKAAAKAIKFMELTEILGQFRIESPLAGMAQRKNRPSVSLSALEGDSREDYTAARQLVEPAMIGRLKLMNGEATLGLRHFFLIDSVSTFLSWCRDIDFRSADDLAVVYQQLIWLEREIRANLQNSAVPQTRRFLWYNWFFIISFITVVQPQRHWGAGTSSRRAKAAPVANALVDRALCAYGMKAFRLYDHWSGSLTLLSKPAEHQGERDKLAIQALKYYGDRLLGGASEPAPDELVLCPVFSIASATHFSKIQTASKEWLQENTSKLLAVPAMVPAGVVAGVLSDSTAEYPAPQTAGQAVTTRLQQTNGPMADTAHCSETLAGNLTASASGAMVREFDLFQSTYLATFSPSLSYIIAILSLSAEHSKPQRNLSVSFGSCGPTFPPVAASADASPPRRENRRRDMAKAAHETRTSYEARGPGLSTG